MRYFDFIILRFEIDIFVKKKLFRFSKYKKGIIFEMYCGKIWVYFESFWICQQLHIYSQFIKHNIFMVLTLMCFLFVGNSIILYVFVVLEVILCSNLYQKPFSVMFNFKEKRFNWKTAQRHAYKSSSKFSTLKNFNF